MHWPVTGIRDPSSDDPLKPLDNEDGTRKLDPEWHFVKTWELMQQLPTEKARAIGVSNFSINNLEALAKEESTTVVPAANQCECHPLLPQHELIEYCKSKGIVFQAYYPMGSSRSPLFTNATLKSIADKYSVSTGEVLINWGSQRGYVVLPKSSNPLRIANNRRLVKLDQQDFDLVSQLVEVEGENRLTKRLNVRHGFPIFE